MVVWSLDDSPRLGATMASLIRDPAHDVLVSSVSLWEIAIKVSIGKLRLGVELSELPRALDSMDFDILPFTGEHALAVADLPWHHKDPFDRALVAQSVIEPMRLVTADARLGRYGAHVLVAG